MTNINIDNIDITTNSLDSAVSNEAENNDITTELNEKKNDFFLFRDDEEGKLALGKIPDAFLSLLDSISNEFNELIDDKRSCRCNMYVNHTGPSIIEKVNFIRNHDFWKQLNDNDESKVIMNIKEIDELLHSNPKDIHCSNLYGTAGLYKHKDMHPCSFPGVDAYIVLIGLTEENDNVITYFNKFDVGHKMNRGDYLVFDFNKNTHQVIQLENKKLIRRLLKTYFIVYDKKYSETYIECVKKIIICYHYTSTWLINIGTEPTNLLGFFIGVGIQYYLTYSLHYYILLFVLLISICITVVFNIYSKPKEFGKYFYINISILSSIYLSAVLFYYFRYMLFNIR